MLLNKERKRSLKAILVSRPPYWSRAAPSQSPAAPPVAAETQQVAGAAQSRRLQLTNEEAGRVPEQSAATGGRRAERRSEMTPQERALVTQSFRARYALSDRQVLANLRRRRRVQLLDEIARLSRVKKDLEEQIDATARRIETVGRVAVHFERGDALLQNASAAEPARSAADAQPASDDAMPGADDK